MSLIFNGSTQALNTSTTLSLGGFSQLTVGFWLHWTTNANDDALGLESSTNVNSNAAAILINPNNSGTAGTTSVVVRASAGAGNSIRFTRPSAGVWHHWLATFDRTAGAQQVTAVYIDGISQTLTQVTTNTTSTGGFGNFTWYMMSRATTSLFGTGRFCELALWPGQLLTASEASTLAGGELPPRIRGSQLMFHWPLRRAVFTQEPGPLYQNVSLIPKVAQPFADHASVKSVSVNRVRFLTGPDVAAGGFVSYPRYDRNHRPQFWN